MPGWKGRVTSRQALWKLWAAEKSLPRHHGNPDKWRERERERRSESSPDCTSLRAVNADTLQSFVPLESAETCFPTVVCPVCLTHSITFNLLTNSVILFCQLDCPHTRSQRHGRFLTSLRDMSHPHPAHTHSLSAQQPCSWPYAQGCFQQSLDVKNVTHPILNSRNANKDIWKSATLAVQSFCVNEHHFLPTSHFSHVLFVFSVWPFVSFLTFPIRLWTSSTINKKKKRKNTRTCEHACDLTYPAPPVHYTHIHTQIHTHMERKSHTWMSTHSSNQPCFFLILQAFLIYTVLIGWHIQSVCMCDRNHYVFRFLASNEGLDGKVVVRAQRSAEPKRREEMKERQNKCSGPVWVNGWGASARLGKTAFES